MIIDVIARRNMVLRCVPRISSGCALCALRNILVLQAASGLMSDNYANKRINVYADKKLEIELAQAPWLINIHRACSCNCCGDSSKKCNVCE